ncbi:MAG TPA: PLP-dependent aminotransferase family protein [Solimonas sp.]
MRRTAKTSSSWASAIERGDKPAYLAIADAIAADIDTGALTANQRLPTLRVLARELDLNFTTVARAYAEARRRGLIDARPRIGTVVRGVAADVPLAANIDMTMNMPPEPREPALLARLEQGLFAGLRGGDPYATLRYQEFGGSVRDRDAGAQWLAPSLPGVDGRQVLACPGMQGALLALFAVLAAPGETIACEAITYPGIQGIAAQLGIRLAGLPLDHEGLEAQAFEALCVARQPKALYCNPTLNNPTTLTWSRQRRATIAAIAQRYGVMIIEDDAYARLPTTPVASLASLAPERTFYLSGLAKCMGAGLRIAYLVPPSQRYAARVAAALRTMAVMAPAPSLAIATRWIGDGTAEAILQAVRGESHQRQRLAARILRRAEYAAHPDGFHLWLKVPEPWSRAGFTEYLRASGIGVVASDAFVVGIQAPEAVRICLGGPMSRVECGHWLEIIEDTVGQMPALTSRVM